MTRARCCLLALLVLAVGAGSAAAQTNVTGDWEMTINSPLGARTAPVSLKQDGEKVTGMFKSPNGELPVNGTITGDELKLAFTVNAQGNMIDIAMTGKVDGPSITGTANFGGMAEGEFSAKRAEAAAASAAPAATATNTAPTPSPTTSSLPALVGGTWTVTIVTPAGEFPATATLVDDGGKLSGTFASQMGEVPVTGTIEGHSLKLSMVAKTPQGDLNVAMTGDVDGDAITNGKADVGGMGQMEWTAKRKQ